MSNQAVGSVYQTIIDEVINSSRVDFEENAVEESVLEELRQVSASVLLSSDAPSSVPSNKCSIARGIRYIVLTSHAVCPFVLSWPSLRRGLSQRQKHRWLGQGWQDEPPSVGAVTSSFVSIMTWMMPFFNTRLPESCFFHHLVPFLAVSLGLGGQV